MRKTLETLECWTVCERYGCGDNKKGSRAFRKIESRGQDFSRPFSFHTRVECRARRLRYLGDTSWRQSAVVTGALRSRLSLKYWREFWWLSSSPTPPPILSLTSLLLWHSPLARCVSPSTTPPPLGHQPKSPLPLSSFSGSLLPPTEPPLPNPILPTHPEI